VGPTHSFVKFITKICATPKVVYKSILKLMAYKMFKYSRTAVMYC